MSTDLGIGCDTCGVHESYEECRDETGLGVSIACAGVIAAAARALSDGGGPSLSLSLAMSLDLQHQGGCDAVSFLTAHAGHDLRVVDEYGDPLPGGCDQATDCPTCGRLRRCSEVKRDHPGPCHPRQGGC